MILINQSDIDYSYVLPDGTVVPGNQPSNPVQTEVIDDLFTKVKTGDKTFLTAGETSVHTVTLTNNSSTTILNPAFRDVMTPGASYVPGSVRVGGVSYPAFDPAAGFSLPAGIPPGGSVAIEYTIKADAPVTQTEVTDYGVVNYQIDDPISGPRSLTSDTNTVTVELVSASVSVVKTADRAYAVRGDVIGYTSTITNTGNTTLSGLLFHDPIPAGTTFVPGSVRVNGVSYPAYNPAVGFALPDLAPGAQVVVDFDVQVN